MRIYTAGPAERCSIILVTGLGHGLACWVKSRSESIHMFIMSVLAFCRQFPITGIAMMLQSLYALAALTILMVNSAFHHSLQTYLQTTWFLLLKNSPVFFYNYG